MCFLLKKGMTTYERDDSFDVQFLSQTCREDLKRLPGNSQLSFEIQVSKKVLAERAKSWESLFEKYSMEPTDAAELNLETLKPVTDTRDDYVPERRVPMRNPPACIQYWVNTGKAPCLAYVDDNYKSDSETSLSETELSAPLPAAAPPFRYNSPQHANVPHGVIKPGPSVVSSSSVDTRDYILSSNLAKRKQSLAIMGSIKSPKKVLETNVNIEDTYVDVCGTDELPKIAVVPSQSTTELTINSQNTTILYPFPTSQDSAIMRAAAGSLKIEDVIPSLQRIRDGPENYNVADVYADKLPFDESEDIIGFERSRTPTPISPPKFEQSVNETRDLNRRKLFTNGNSPIELTAPSKRVVRKISMISNLHPAFQAFDLALHQRKSNFRRKKFLFRKKLPRKKNVEEEQKKQIKEDNNQVNKADPNDKDLEKEDESSDRDLDSKSKRKSDEICEEDIPLEKRIKERTAPKIIPNLGENFQDLSLKKKPLVRFKQTSDSFIQRSRQNSASKKSNRKTKRVSFKEKSIKKVNVEDKKAKVSFVKAGINDELINKKELKIRELIVSLERLPVVMLERLSRKNVNTSKSQETLPKETSSEVLSRENDLQSSSVNKSSATLKKKISIFVDSDDEECLDGNSRPELSKKSDPTKNKLTFKTNLCSSDEEDLFLDIKKKRQNVNQKSLSNRQGAEDEKLKENFITSDIKKGTNSFLKFKNKEQNSPLKLNNKLENVQKPIKVNFTFSSDEDDDFSKIFEKSSLGRSKTFKNGKELSKTLNCNSKTKKIVQTEFNTICGPFPVEELHINGFKKKISNTNENVTKGDNNLQQKNSKVDVNDKGGKETVNSNLSNFGPFEFEDTRRMSRFVIVSSEDSSDSESKAEIVSQQTKSLEQKSSKRKSTNLRKNLLNSTKFSGRKSNLESLQEVHSNSSDDSRILLKSGLGPSREPENPKSHINRNETENAKKVETPERKKSGTSVFQESNDSDSMSDCDLFTDRKKFSSHSRMETRLTDQIKETKSSKMKSFPKKLQNNHFVNSNLQTAKGIAKPMKRLSTLNKRKRPGFSGSISSDSEESKSDSEFLERRQAKKVKTFQNGRNVTRILQQSEKIRGEAENTSLNSSLNIFRNNLRRDSSPNIFGDNCSRDSSLNIFDSPQNSSDDETILNLKFKSLQKGEGNNNSVKRVRSGIKLPIFRTKSFWESDSD